MTSPSSEDTPLTDNGNEGGFCFSFKRHWKRMTTGTQLVIAVAFVSYTLENLLSTTPSTLYPAIVKSVVATENPNCTHPESAKNLIRGESNPACVVEYKTFTLLMGLLVAAKPAAELLLSMVVGGIIDKCGHKMPMIVGCFFNAVGCVGFAFAPTFWLLMLTRILQGLGSALSLMCSSVLLAATFEDREELSRAIGMATVGLGLGGVLGWPFGAFTYELLGRPGPFLILAGACIFDGFLRVISSPPTLTRADEVSTKEAAVCGWCDWQVISDPHIFISLFNIFYYSFFISLFSTFQPPYVFDRLEGKIWEIGTIVLIALVFQVVLQILTGYVALRVGLWRLTFVGFLCCGASCIIFTFLNYIWQVLGTELLNRVGHAFILASSFVQYKLSSEERPEMSYGGRMALLSMSYNLGIMLGPLIGALILNMSDYSWLFRGLGVSVFISALPTLFFRQSSNYEHTPLEEDKDTTVATPSLGDANELDGEKPPINGKD